MSRRYRLRTVHQGLERSHNKSSAVSTNRVYQRAKHELAGRVVGFGYAREWPASSWGTPDVDSGPIIPGLEISLGSSGQALLAATTFEDAEFTRELLTSLNFGGFPVSSHGELRYAASNAVGDAMVLYSLVQGPLWDEIRKRAER